MKSSAEPGFVRPRLINIKTDHVMPDKLHLLLRITDRLIENLINQVTEAEILLKGP